MEEKTLFDNRIDILSRKQLEIIRKLKLLRTEIEASNDNFNEAIKMLSKVKGNIIRSSALFSEVSDLIIDFSDTLSLYKKQKL